MSPIRNRRKTIAKSHAIPHQNAAAADLDALTVQPRLQPEKMRKAKAQRKLRIDVNHDKLRAAGPNEVKAAARRNR
jgi:hypothetical protein